MTTNAITEYKYWQKSVPHDEREKILEVFRTDGFVVVTGVLTPDETNAILDELWTSPRLLGRPGIDRNDPTTWKENWPQSNGGKNFLASSDVFQDAASWDLVSNERIAELQRLLYQRNDIMSASLGRWGVMRPTIEHPEWKTESSWLHWDQNPWAEPGFVRLQAIVCLTNNTETSGGFACVPGFHNQFRKWGEEHPKGSVFSPSGRALDETYGVNQPFPIPKADPCQREVVRVLAPAGSMVLWDSRLPHQNFPNTDTKEFRVIHYTMMIVKDEQSVREWRKLMRQKTIVMDVLGIRGQRFPHKLSSAGKELNCIDDDGDGMNGELGGVTEELSKAIPLVLEAEKAEEMGDVATAIKCHQKALRLYPDIEDWYGAILG